MDYFITNILKRIMSCTLILGLNACVEPFVAETETFESVLVIEATITNELKQQELLLSRTFRFEEDGPKPERNSEVQIEDDMGTTYAFTEAAPGTYVSEQEFAAQEGRSYQLYINTSNGRTYSSDPITLTATADIEEVYAERTTIGGTEGMAIKVNAGGTAGNARNYRYQFEETYKIIAPEWTPQDLIGDPEGGCNVLVVSRENEERVCYATDDSNTIILTDTNSFPEDRVNGFVVRFINRNNYIISHRYSILVRQFVQSPEAYSFFETLDQFSGSESLFSETQPGFLAANIFSVDNPLEKVLGYFDVASVTERRIFFNYDDFFPGEPLPPYVNACNYTAPILVSMGGGCVLRPTVEANLVRYVGANTPGPFSPGDGPYLVTPRVCGDCTALGPAEIPEFWTEE